MTAKTIAEKILSRHAGKRVSAGEIVYCSIDFMMAHDANGPMAIKAFEEMGGLGLRSSPDRPDYGPCLSRPP